MNYNGKTKKGWLQYGESWYYLDSDNGVMQTGVVEYDGKEYNFGIDGKLQIDEDTEKNDEGGLIEVPLIKVTNGSAVTYDGIAYFFKNVHALFDFEMLNGMGEHNGELGVIYVTEEQEELADAGADILTGEFAEDFVPIIVNGIKAYKSLKTGEIIYSKSFSANSGIGNAFEGAGKGKDIINGTHRYVASQQTGIPVEIQVTQGSGPIGLSDWSEVRWKEYINEDQFWGD